MFRGYEPLPNHQRAMAVLALKKMVELARRTTRSGRAVSGRAVSLRILCNQLEHTRANLAHLEAEIERLLTDDPQVKGLQQIPEFGSKTVAVLRPAAGLSSARKSRQSAGISRGRARRGGSDRVMPLRRK